MAAAAAGDATAEPLQYTTTVLRVSIHCEGCKKKVKKVLHSIEGVYKVTIDAMQHKVTVTGGVGADALVRRLLKSGKQASLWPVAEATKVGEVAAAPSSGKSGKDKEAAMEAADSEKKDVSEKKPEKAEAKKPKEKEVPEKEKCSPEPAKEAPAEEDGGEETGGKKGKKKKNKQKDVGEGDAAAEKQRPPPPRPPKHPHQQPKHAIPVPSPPALGPPDRHHGGFPYYAPQPAMSYNVAHPSASVSYYAPTPVVSMQPMPPQMAPYGYPPMMPPPELTYGPPGVRSSPPQETYSTFNEENPNPCGLM